MNRSTLPETAPVPDDASLVRSCCGNDRESCDELVRRHQDRIFNLCLWFLGDYQDADDCSQEIFLKAFGSINRFRQEASFSTWLYRIAVNTCQNRLKSLEYRYRKWMHRLDSTGFDESDAPGKELAGDGMSPEMALQSKQRSQIVRRAIDTLSADKRTIVLLRDMEGLSYTEIAAVTGHKPGTVKSKLARARRDLGRKLSHVKGVM